MTGQAVTFQAVPLRVGSFLHLEHDVGEPVRDAGLVRRVAQIRRISQRNVRRVFEGN